MHRRSPRTNRRRRPRTTRAQVEAVHRPTVRHLTSRPTCRQARLALREAARRHRATALRRPAAAPAARIGAPDQEAAAVEDRQAMDLLVVTDRQAVARLALRVA